MSTTVAKLDPDTLLPNTSALMGHWSFDGTLDDVSPNRVGPAVIVAGTSATALAFETQWPDYFEPNSKGFVKVRSPGWLTIPALPFIQNQSFTIGFSVRVTQAPTAVRDTLIGNWLANNWQFTISVESNLTLSCLLRRNIEGTERDLVQVLTASPVTVGSWVDVAFTYDATKRTLAVYLNGVKSNSATIRSSVTDTVLHTSPSTTFQIGMKADDTPNTGTLNADLRDVRFFKLYASVV
ncbi:concanavalin A-like lectin/glucanase domain-containing protein [Panaeolus papilionaceus]|nr:concanavalin A-like lectin/glucanase domain-containing protein [Panaeolus papilionaceus]